MANVKANHSNVVIKVLKNKYVKVRTESGLILPTGMALSQETGEIESNLSEIIALCEIVDAGPECKYHNVGDEVYSDSRSFRPLPFMGMGYFIINEQNILCKVVE